MTAEARASGPDLEDGQSDLANFAHLGRDHGPAPRAQWRQIFAVVADDPVASFSEGRRCCAGQQDSTHRLVSPYKGQSLLESSSRSIERNWRVTEATRQS